MWRLLTILALAGWALTHGYANAQPQTVILTAVDVSDSIDEQEFGMEMAGMARAVVDPRFLATVGNGVVFEVYTWSSAGAFSTIVPATVIRNAEDAAAIASILMAQNLPDTSRYPAMGYRDEYSCMSCGMTDIAGAIREGVRRLALLGGRGVLNVLADGKDNVSYLPEEARDEAEILGITINAAIFDAAAAEEGYFWLRITTSDGFVINAEDSAQLPIALERKFFRDMVAALY